MKIEILSETNDGYRNLLTCSMLLPLTVIFEAIYTEQWQICINWKWAAIPLFIMLFLFAYREQTGHIRNRVGAINKQQSEKESSEKT